MLVQCKQVQPHLKLSETGCRGRDHMVVECTTTCPISAYHHYRCVFARLSWRGVLDTRLCDKVCQGLSTGQWFSTGTLVSSTNKADHNNIIEILKVSLNTINLNQTYLKRVFLLTHMLL